MNKYTVNWDYSASFRDKLLRFEQGEVVTLDEETAAWVNRDSEGCLTLVVETEARAMVEPPQDRMVKQAKTRKDRESHPNEGAMSRNDFKAVTKKDN